MNFRDYATRIQAQAAAAAKRIPTFDDMAAKDDYIHSEEFKVRGQPRVKRDVPLKSDQVVLATTMEPDETSSISSWSLLDRPTIRSSPFPSDHEVTRGKVETSSHQGPTTAQRWIDTAPMSSNTSLSSEAPSTHPLEAQRNLSSGLPVLSVVAKALEAKDDGKVTQIETPGSDESNSNADSSDDDSTDSADEDDMHDPILSMIRKNKPPSKRIKPKGQRRKDNKSQNEQSITKSKQRFLHEIDEEEVAMASFDGIESGLPLPLIPPGPQPTDQGSRRLPGWFQRFTSSSSNRVGAPGQKQQSNVLPANQQTSAPLTRERMKKSVIAQPTVEEYHQADARAVLGDEELAQLATMTNSNKTTCSALAGFIEGHRRFAFIIFTLLLAWLVYTLQKSTDTVS